MLAFLKKNYNNSLGYNEIRRSKVALDFRNLHFSSNIKAHNANEGSSDNNLADWDKGEYHIHIYILKRLVSLLELHIRFGGWPIMINYEFDSLDCVGITFLGMALIYIALLHIIAKLHWTCSMTEIYCCCSSNSECRLNNRNRILWQS